jgi:hypothetical protein
MKRVVGVTIVICGISVVGMWVYGASVGSSVRPVRSNHEEPHETKLNAPADVPAMPIKDSHLKHSLHSNTVVSWLDPSTGSMMRRSLSDQDILNLKKLIKNGHTQAQALLSLPGDIKVTAPRDHHMQRPIIDVDVSSIRTPSRDH